MSTQEKILRVAFAAGAITDGLALFPLTNPSSATLLWGFSNSSAEYRFAMGYAASLMLGWTLLLIWAMRRPMERRAVAAFTLLVVCGLMLTEVEDVISGHLPGRRFAPTLCLQAVLMSLFAVGFNYDRIQRHTRTGSSCTTT